MRKKPVSYRKIEPSKSGGEFYITLRIPKGVSEEDEVATLYLLVEFMEKLDEKLVS